jgi:hypothetical protein
MLSDLVFIMYIFILLCDVYSYFLIFFVLIILELNLRSYGNGNHIIFTVIIGSNYIIIIIVNYSNMTCKKE